MGVRDRLVSGVGGRIEFGPSFWAGRLARRRRALETGENAARLDPGRVRRFLAGYASIIPVSPEQAAVIPVYLRGRGLQMIAKRLRAGHADTAMLPQVQWLTAHHQAVTDTLAAALR
jgi:Ser/Thr protein kinase RdoA (MazF antagonist)